MIVRVVPGFIETFQHVFVFVFTRGTIAGRYKFDRENGFVVRENDRALTVDLSLKDRMSADCYILIEKPEGRKNNMGNHFILADTLRMEDIEPIAAADINLSTGSLQAGLVGKRKADESVFLIVITDGFVRSIEPE